MFRFRADRSSRQARPRPCLTIAVLALLAGCSRCGRDGSRVLARYDGGEVTAEEVQRESSRLPPALRSQFDTDAGRREFVASLVDKRLLVKEAERRGYAEDAEIRRQVRELRERLVVQALLAAEEKKAGAASEAELRAWYEAHRGELSQPARVRVGRVLARAAPNASPAERARARSRAESFASRLRRGEPFQRVAADGDGPEKAHGGEFGLVARGGRDAPLERAAFALQSPGEVSAVVACEDGFAVLRLVERREARVPPFEEVRGEVANRLEPLRKRKAFDALVESLRSGGKVELQVAEARR